jgi:hypothetical protein
MMLATGDAAWALLVRLAAGGVFIAFSLGKFRRHHANVAAKGRHRSAHYMHLGHGRISRDSNT